MKGPEAALKELGLELPGAVDPDSPAVLEPSHRLVVNGQFYWASSMESAEVLRTRPHLYVGPVRDPVTRELFTPTKSSPRRDTDSGLLYFASNAAAQVYDRNPGNYGGR